MVWYGTFIQIKAFVVFYWEQIGLGSGGPGPSSNQTPTDSWMIMIKERPWIYVLFPISPLHLPSALSLLKLSDHCHTTPPHPSLSLTHSHTHTHTHTVICSETSSTLKNKCTEPGLVNVSRSLPVMLRPTLLLSSHNVPSTLQHSKLAQVKPLSIWQVWPFWKQFCIYLLFIYFLVCFIT